MDKRVEALLLGNGCHGPPGSTSSRRGGKRKRKGIREEKKKKKNRAACRGDCRKRRRCSSCSRSSGSSCRKESGSKSRWSSAVSIKDYYLLSTKSQSTLVIYKIIYSIKDSSFMYKEHCQSKSEHRKTYSAIQILPVLSTI